MATQSIIRNGAASPVRAMSKTTRSSRSILKRPVALPLSPLYASFSVQAQVSPHIKSLHVQFLSSSSLVSTFAAHSPASYDRAPISVSPLERTYVTSLEGFKLSAPPKPFRLIARAQGSPAITGFEDPRSPKAQPVSSLNGDKKPAPLDLESQLNRDFWQSLSLQEAEKSADETMVTALEYPVSAVEYEGKLDMDTMSQPPVMFASADGVLWSPKPGAAGKDITAPSPHDPFSKFPSFTYAAIEMGSLTYPPRAALECGI